MDKVTQIVIDVTSQAVEVKMQANSVCLCQSRPNSIKTISSSTVGNQLNDFPVLVERFDYLSVPLPERPVAPVNIKAFEIKLTDYPDSDMAGHLLAGLKLAFLLATKEIIFL